MSLKTKVTLLVHHRELKRTTNTGRLALEALPNSSLVIRGLPQQPLNFAEILSPEFQPILLYPAEGSQELTPDFLTQFKRPIQLLVPDGNWRQASKVSIRSKELEGVPRVVVTNPVSPLLFLRKETKPGGMATLEAIALALGVLEGMEVQEKLMALYNLKLHRTLEARGQKFKT